MKFLCTAVVLLATASKTSASFFELVSHSDPVPEPAKPKAPVPPSSSSSFGIVSPSSQPKKESSQEGVMSLEAYQKRQRQEQEPGSQPLVGSSGSSYSSSSSGSSMASRPVPALSPKPALRENDLTTREQALDYPLMLALKGATFTKYDIEGNEIPRYPFQNASRIIPDKAERQYAFSSNPHMASRPVSALSPKPALRENDLTAIKQAKKQEGEVEGEEEEEEEQPGSVVSSSSPSSSSSSSSSMSSSTSSKRLSPDQLAYDNIYGAIQSNNVGEVRRLIELTPVFLRAEAFDRSNAPGREQAMFEILMSLKGYVFPSDFQRMANRLLPHLKGENKMTLEAILSDKTGASLSAVRVGSRKEGHYQRNAYQELYDAILSNHAEEVRALLPVTPFLIRSLVFAKSDPSRNSNLLLEVLMSMKKELFPSDFKENAQKLLPHLQSRQHEELLAIIGA